MGNDGGRELNYERGRERSSFGAGMIFGLELRVAFLGKGCFAQRPVDVISAVMLLDRRRGSVGLLGNVFPIPEAREIFPDKKIERAKMIEKSADIGDVVVQIERQSNGHLCQTY